MSTTESGVLSRITLFPIKSLPGVVVPESRVLPSGSLEWDRRLAIVDASDKIVNAKRNVELHQLRASYRLDVSIVQISGGGGPARAFHLVDDLDALGDFLTCALGKAVRVIEDRDTGFPDDEESRGPTVISLVTLQRICSLFQGLSLEDIRRRFRTNLEISDVPEFWEDRLFGPDDVPISFDVGSVRFGGTNPCVRCVVPTRVPETGEETPLFAKIFAMFRQERLPEWAPRERFTHFYRLATNTILLNAGSEGVIRVGDPVTLC